MAREEARESHSIKGPHWGGVYRRVTHFPGPLPSSDELGRVVPTDSHWIQRYDGTLFPV